MKKERNNHYTFMFFPEGRGTPFTLLVPRYVLYLTVISVILIVLGLVVLLYKSGEIALRLQLVQNLKQENIRLKEYANDLKISSQKIASIDSMTVYLHRLANVTSIIDTRPENTQAVVVDKNKPVVQTAQAEVARPDGKSIRKDAPFIADFVSSVPNIMPVDGWITKHFAKTQSSDSHNGLDIAAIGGTPIRVTAMGTVEEIRSEKYLGLTVEVRHENGFLTRYGHCSQVLVSEGDRVNRGQTIALVGSTGRSTAPHVHYEVMKNGKYVDPMSFIGAHKQ